jgi:hypothetical protein
MYFSIGLRGDRTSVFFESLVFKQGKISTAKIGWNAIPQRLRFFLIRYCQRLIIELNIATAKIIKAVFYSNRRCFLYLQRARIIPALRQKLSV